MKEILQVENVTKKYLFSRGLIFQKKISEIKAVDRVSFSIERGETFGLVGETGCGKSTIARLILGLIQPDKGDIYFEGQNINLISRRKLNLLRRKMQLIFQDPFASLNPRMTVAEIISEPFIIHNVGTKKERRKRVYELLEIVGLNRDDVMRYPHEFSGGQQQRIGIARALALYPRLIVCDEPVSALDLSIQAQILNLLIEIQERFKLTYLFISHDLSVVKNVSDRVAVMYLGKIVELAKTSEIYNFPYHPYTRALISAIPQLSPRQERRQRIILRGEVPKGEEGSSGCRFASRCWKKEDICIDVEPKFQEFSPNHWVACYFPEVSRYLTF